MTAVLKKSTPGKFASTCHFQQIGINATKIEKTEIHFKTDVFAAVAVVDAKAPYFHTMIPDSSYAGTKTTPGRASIYTYKRSFRRDFCSGAKLHRADLESGESRIGFVPHVGEV